MMRKLICLLCLLSGLFCLQAPAGAESFPDRPIHLVVTFPPGGGTDLFARVLGEAMGTSMGQSVVVVNRAGAQGSVGLAYVAHAAPDGYTIGLAEVGSIAMVPWMYKQVGFDPLKDFTPLSLGAVYPNAVVIGPSVKASNLKEFVVQAKQGKLTYASSSASSQLAGALFKMAAKVDMLDVPYKGAGPAAMDLAAGRVDMTCVTAASAVQMASGGRTRVIAVTGPERLAALPGVVTARESGYPDFEMVGWYGLVAPAGTPPQVVAKLNAEIRAALAKPAVREQLASAGLEAKSGTPEEMGALLKSEFQRWGKVAKAVGIQPE